MQTEGPMRRKKQKAKDNATGQPCASPSSWPVLTAGLDPLALPSVFSFFFSNLGLFYFKYSS